MDKETINLFEKLLYTAGIVTGFWKFVDTFFLYLKNRQKGYLSELIDEMLKAQLGSLKTDMQELKRQREADSRAQIEQYQSILRELKK